MGEPLQFLFAILVLLFAPGPTNTIMAVAGAGGAGKPSPVPLLCAEVAGYVALVVVARLVLLPVIDAYPVADVAIRVVVIAYLVFAAVRLWAASLSLATGTAAVVPLTVFLTTFLNPKGLILAFSVFPRESAHIWAYFAAFAVVAAAGGLAWFALGRRLARAAGPRATLLPRVGSLALLVFAALLATSAAR